jgi:flagellar basal body-associated protein FliL
MINDSFETASNNCNRESTSRRRVRLVLLQVWVVIAILAVVGYLNFASADRARAQEAETMSCKEKCTHQEKVCLYNGGSEEMCDYDYKVCKKACDEQK